MCVQQLRGICYLKLDMAGGNPPNNMNLHKIGGGISFVSKKYIPWNDYSVLIFKK